MGKIIKDGITYAGSASTAKRIKYDNKNSGLASTSVQNAIDELSDRPVNNNILINSNFKQPVNQRGQTTYNTITDNIEYTVDRWSTYGTSVYPTDVIVLNDCVRFSTKLNAAGFVQKVEFPEKYCGRTMTLSAEFSNITGNMSLIIADGVGASHVQITENGVYELTHTVASDATLLQIYVKNASESGSTSSCDIHWMKLELGDVATPYVPRLYAEELELCKRYYSKQNVIAHLTAMNADRVVFIGQLRGNSRVVPTATIGDGGVIVGGYATSGFEYSVDVVTYDGIIIHANKTNHGLSLSDIIYLNIDVILDAEL